MKSRKIYYGQAVYDNKEINAAINLLKKQKFNLIVSVNVKKLEKTVCKIFGKKFGLMVNSGSSANLLALHSVYGGYEGWSSPGVSSGFNKKDLDYMCSKFEEFISKVNEY